MKKEIKQLIEKKLFNFNNIFNDIELDNWDLLIYKYSEKVKDTVKGVVLKCRYFEKKKWWRCQKELQKIRYYSEKDNFYRIVNEIINDIVIRASYERLLNPYEFDI